MPAYRPIWIGCPQYHCLVRGEYACDGQGGYRLAPGGQFLLEHVRCGHRAGRCVQTLCTLHRHNRRGPGSWYPSGIWAFHPRRQTDAPPRRPDTDHRGWYA